jgi:hypothetical protein
MSIYFVSDTFYVPPYQFFAHYDSGDGFAGKSRDLYYAEVSQKIDLRDPLEFTPPENTQFLRTFYFDECNPRHMKNFCNKFSQDPDYRVACLAETTPWARRNALFSVNAHCHWEFRCSDPKKGNGTHEPLFRFISKHYESILADPEFQKKCQYESETHNDKGAIDPDIEPYVKFFNTLPDCVTQFSCQGVGEPMWYEGQKIYPISQHMPKAHISFKKLSKAAETYIKNIVEKNSRLRFGGFVYGITATTSNKLFLKALAEIKKETEHLFTPNQSME